MSKKNAPPLDVSKANVLMAYGFMFAGAIFAVNLSESSSAGAGLAASVFTALALLHTKIPARVKAVPSKQFSGSAQ